MGRHGMGLHHAPDVVILAAHVVHKGWKRCERSEYTIVGEKNLLCGLGAATVKQKLPSAEI